jgi:hypothetical protein
MPLKSSTYLSVFAWLSFVFGAAFLLLTSTMLPMYGLPVDPAHLVQGRYFGATLAGGGLLPWLLRNSQEVTTQRSALLACAIAAALGLIVSVWGLVDKVLGPLGWSSVLLYGLLMLVAAYLMRSPTSPRSHGP